MPPGRKNGNVEFFNLLMVLSGHVSKAEFAKGCGLTAANATSYLSGNKIPQAKVLKRSMEYLFGWPIRPLSEIEPLPTDLAQLPNKPGLYVLYDSGGNILYVGKATNFATEIRQTLKRNVPVPLRMGPSLKKSKPAIHKLASLCSLYQIDQRRTRHKFESLFLRVLANQTHNSNIGTFKDVAP
jgi:hypothetical protein